MPLARSPLSIKTRKTGKKLLTARKRIRIPPEQKTGAVCLYITALHFHAVQSIIHTFAFSMKGSPITKAEIIISTHTNSNDQK